MHVRIRNDWRYFTSQNGMIDFFGISWQWNGYAKGFEVAIFNFTLEVYNIK